MIAGALILNKVLNVTQGQHMTNFADIKSKMADCSHFLNGNPLADLFHICTHTSLRGCGCAFLKVMTLTCFLTYISAPKNLKE